MKGVGSMITKSSMPLPSWSLCCIWHHRPQHLRGLITCLSPRFGIHGSVLWWFKSYLSSLLLWCSPRLCSRPSILPLPSQYSDLFPFPWPPTFMQMTLSSSSSSTHSTLTQAFRTFKTLFNRSLFRMTANLLTLNSSKTEFLLIRLENLVKIDNCSLDTSHSARNLVFIFDERLTFFDQIG